MTTHTDTRPHTTGAEAKDPRPEPAAPVSPEPANGWTPICPLERLQPERGVGALVDGQPVAVFRTHDDHLYALHNLDPFSGASVLSRGILGDHAGTPVVASPLYKQHFALATGTAIEDQTITVATYPVRVVNGTVEVGSA
jgi:nitrite reductase (NADH) small subunit